MINLVNKQVTHKSFGKGNVVNYNDSYIKIHFKSGKKRFVFPDAFEKYLTFIDQGAADMVRTKIQKKEIERKKELLKQKKEEKEKALQREQQRFLERQKSARNPEIYSRSQSVFWCKPEEQEKVFTEWSIFVGEIKSGQNKGQPRRLARVNQNSACLLTTRNPNVPEKDRRILGVFMVDEGFSGRNCKDGYIPAHPKYRIRFSKEESEKMFFWNYYTNERYPDRIVWNSGRHRYFDNIWMAQILRDIILLKEESKEQEYVKGFFEYFCRINNINENELPEPSGPLMHI